MDIIAVEVSRIIPLSSLFLTKPFPSSSEENVRPSFRLCCFCLAHYLATFSAFYPFCLLHVIKCFLTCRVTVGMNNSRFIRISRCWPYIFHKINSKLIIELNIKCKTIKLLEDNRRSSRWSWAWQWVFKI